jgi:hypothetical protein
MDDARDQRSVEPAGKTVSTPEGDNEFAPDQPLQPSEVEADVRGLQPWPTNSAMEYDKDRRPPEDTLDENDPHRHNGVQRVIDEISTGKILPG